MVVPINAVRYGAGFDAAGQWHEAKADRVRAEDRLARSADLAPARGAVIGLVLSSAIWVGLVMVVRAAWALMR